LSRDVSVRALSTMTGAGTAWTAARFTGTRRGADTVGLAALVGTQLGQTLLAAHSSPLVAVSSLGSLAALVAVIQTPGLSQFFGCRPLGPLGWSLAAGSATGATLGHLALRPLVDRVVTEEFLTGLRDRVRTAAGAAHPMMKEEA
jgi:cation-transporting P-type ATPase I